MKRESIDPNEAEHEEIMRGVTIIKTKSTKESFTEHELAKFNVTDASIAEMKEKYMALKIVGIEDKKGYEAVHEARMIVVKKRTGVDKTTKELNEDARLYINAVNGESKRIKALLAPIEDYLDSEETRIDNERETLKREAILREQKRIQERIDKLSAYGYGVDYAEIKDCTDMSFNTLLEEAKEMHEKDLAEKAAESKKRKEEAEQLIIERLELEVLRQQQVYEANILMAERVRIQKEQQAREEAIDAEKKAIELQKQKEAEEKKRFQELEEARRQAIEDRKREEILAKEAAERELALRPDKEKLQAFAKELSLLKLPAVKNAKAQIIVNDVQEMIKDIQAHITTKVKRLSSVMPAEYKLNDSVTLVTDIS